jgi:5'-nucleotidase
MKTLSLPATWTRQQHETGTGTTIHFACTGKGQHSAYAAQIVIDQFAQDRAALSGAQPLAMNNAHHARAHVQAFRQKLAQDMFRLRCSQSVQIQFCLDPIVATTQIAEDLHTDARTLEENFISRLDDGCQRMAQISEAFGQHGKVISPREPGFGFALGHGFAAHGNFHLKPAHATHGLAKCTAICQFVVALRFAQLEASGGQQFLVYLCLQFLARSRMKILVSNDDGYRAEGIVRLNEALGSLASTTIMAPDRNRSGASNSLTLDVPLRVFESEKNVYFVTGGTPTDCVHIAISGYFRHEFDLVCAGINDGANLGDDTLYSGTVAAAIEGRFLGLPTVAFSLCMEPDSGRHFAAAARVAHSLIERLIESPLERGFTLNVNIPDVPFEQIRGMKATRLGGRHRSKPIIPTTDPKGRKLYWIGPSGDGQDAGEGTDFDAVARGYVSVTPLQIDLTRHTALAGISEWLKPLA